MRQYNIWKGKRNGILWIYTECGLQWQFLPIYKRSRIIWCVIVFGIWNYEDTNIYGNILFPIIMSININIENNDDYRYYLTGMILIPWVIKVINLKRYPCHRLHVKIQFVCDLFIMSIYLCIVCACVRVCVHDRYLFACECV